MLKLQANVNCAVNAETDKSLCLCVCLCMYEKPPRPKLNTSLAHTYRLSRVCMYAQCYYVYMCKVIYSQTEYVCARFANWSKNINLRGRRMKSIAQWLMLLPLVWETQD